MIARIVDINNFMRSLPVVLLCVMTTLPAAPTSASFETLAEGAVVQGFRASALYLNDSDQPFGARFLHLRTGFTLDLIRLQSVPQAFTWVVSYPTSDKGEPHTQEHLLVGKGNQGRAFAGSQNMSLTQSSAFTEQWRTCYHFNTTAGTAVFYKQFETQLDALLHPDYTDEEIRREVRNFGVSQTPDRLLRLEEKGSVYNEMVSSMTKPGLVIYRAFGQTVYGPEHPLAYNSGGEPAGIRELRPEDIRKFHHDHYFLENMGSIVSLPKGETLFETLGRLAEILNRVQTKPVQWPVQRASSLPAPEPADAGRIQIFDYPYQNEQQPGIIALAWPANRRLELREQLLMNMFLDAFAGDATTNLYQLFVNSKTRQLDLGARGVFNSLSDDQGNPLLIALSEVAAQNLTESKIAEVREKVNAELARIASWADGSPELIEFNARVSTRATEFKRFLSKLSDSPPAFGLRNTYATWLEHLTRVNQEPGFRKSITLKPDNWAIGQLLAANKNLWKDRLQRWHLIDTVPYGLAVRPSADLLKKEAAAHEERAAAEVRRLRGQYSVTDDQEALKRYRTDYDRETATLDELARQSASVKFIDNPPLTLDEQIDYQVHDLPGNVPLVSSTFDNMSGTTVGLALRLDGIAESDLPLLSLLPALITQTGVVLDGKPVPYETMQEMLRKEILSLTASFISNVHSNRVELLLTGAGNNAAENQRAVEWMRRVLLYSYWQPENLPRIRDLVDQSLSGLRSTMQRPEEAWVRNPVLAYYKQTNPLYLASSSFLSQAHNVDRLRWMLTDAGSPEDLAAISGFLEHLAQAPSQGNRADLKTLLTALRSDSMPAPALAGYKEELARLSEPARKVTADALKDLDQMLPDLPDSSLASDWSYLCLRIKQDLAVTPALALQKLKALRALVFTTGNARLWMAGSSDSQQKLAARLAALVASLKPSQPKHAAYAAQRRIDQRLHERVSDAVAPHFVGLFNPNMQGGVILTLVPFVDYDQTTREQLLQYLSSKLFAGGGPHSVFTKTIGAGLAYSNGVNSSVHDGYATYYAERVPDISQTLHFAIDVVKRGPRDPQLAEYAIAQAFRESYAAGAYEVRARSIADDLADGITPEKVKRFRTALLNLRREPKLASELFARVDTVYGKPFPGYGPQTRNVPGAVYYIIGADKQFNTLDAEVQSREDEHVFKLYPRDYWLMPVVETSEPQQTQPKTVKPKRKATTRRRR